MEKKKYRQLFQEERERIYRFLRKGVNLSEIGRRLGRDTSTVSREIRRNRNQKLLEYLPDTAMRKAERRRECSRKKAYVEKDAALREYVLCKLLSGWSPEQISGRIEKETGQYLNFESIYQWVYSLEGRKANLRQYLRRSHRVRRKRHGRKSRRGKIPNRVDISARPLCVEARREFGHWEGDSVVYGGQKECLSTQVERKTRYCILLWPHDRSADARAQIINDRFRHLPISARRSLTLDNGLEFARHEEITRRLEMSVYFARPYSSWQRGTNENTNGLLRWYLPQKTDLASLLPGTIEWVEDQLNNRPRKCLGFDTPAEAFARELNAFKP